MDPRQQHNPARGELASDSSSKRVAQLVLVSGSPRRKALLEQLGLSFTVMSPNVDESIGESQSPQAYVRSVANRKLAAYIEGFADSQAPTDQWALAADTIVVYRKRIIGKPVDRRDAEQVLRSLSGHVHRVITALALYNPYRRSIAVETAITRVVFAPLTEEEIEWYLRSGEWEGVAGGYRIQERGSVLVKRIVGSYSNVVGLPIELFYGMVQAQGYELFPVRG